MTCPVGTAAGGGVCLRPNHSSPQSVQGLAGRILAEHQFRVSRPALILRLFDWIGRGIEDGLNAFFTNGGLSIVGALAAGLILLTLLFFAIRFGTRVRPDPKVDVATAPRIRRRPVEWTAEAAVHEAAGEWRDALRCRYRALVAELSTRDVVDEVPGRTAREYERQVHDRLPSSAAAFDEASDLFEAAWYGNEPTGRSEGERFRQLAARVLERSGR